MEKTVGIVGEYNPFHLGHQKQINWIRQEYGQNTKIVCILSGNFVQRGEPSIFDKWSKSQAAVACGVNLVVELPVTKALASAEGFAQGAVACLSRLGCVTHLCFGSECGDLERLQETARLLLCPEFHHLVRQKLETGISYAAARDLALADMGGQLVSSPNDILGVEYCKAILSLGSAMEPVTLTRQGSYHDLEPDQENPSATALRRLIEAGEPWMQFVPPAAAEVFSNAPVHLPQAGERAVLARLATMTSQEFAQLPYGGEGLHYKLEKACRKGGSVQEILAATKSKRYAWSRLARMVACGYLGIDQAMMEQEISYVRALAFDQEGRKLIRQARSHGEIAVVNGGETPKDLEYWQLEQRAGDLYALFSTEKRPIFGQEANGRSFCVKK